MEKGIKTAAMLEIQKDIDESNLKMWDLLKSDKGITIIKENGQIKRVDLTMDKTLFDMYWNIRQKAYKRLEELAKL